MASSHLVRPSASYLRPVSLPKSNEFSYPSSSFLLSIPSRQTRMVSTMAKNKSQENPLQQPKNPKNERTLIEEEVEVEVEEDLPWIQEKAIDLVEFTGSVTQAIPGPRVGGSSLPWILAVPLAYAGITFVIAFVKTVRKFNSPKQKRRKLVNKNALLCKSIDELFKNGLDEVQHSTLKGLMQKTDFDMEEILRKYIRYAMNEKPFNPEMVADLIQLRKASMLDDTQVAEILNEISRRIVRDKGNPSYFIAQLSWIIQGILRRVSRENLLCRPFFGRFFIYLREDADNLRIQTLSEYGDVDLLQKMIDTSDSEESSEGSSNSS
ncbi:hypothetical protein HHK36_024053 [Tetracentron sinense]|uniref:Armadillo-like repeats domain-containing protein n=1 Tax=Tetracentron sinense TaxID=13715 RepID=A0A835D3S6_TETSI|nr:hypothetical protein HHK36_024053 [Tetracentron sinense]